MNQYVKNIKAKKKIDALFVGRKNFAKGFDLFYQLSKDFPSHYFFAVGRPEESISSTKNFKQIDYLPIKSLAKCIIESKVVICPSRYEYFGLVPLISISLGIPVIATRVGGHRDVVKDGKTGLLIEPDNYPSLKRAFQQAMRKNIIILKSDRKSLIEKCNWDAFVKKIVTHAKMPERVFRGDIITVNIQPQEINGHLINYEQVLLPASVHIIPIDHRGRIILLKEKKIYQKDFTLHVIAGIVNKGESVLQAAKRELAEEAGLCATKWKLLTVMRRSDVVKDTRYYYVAQNISLCHKSREATENIQGIQRFNKKSLSQLWEKGIFGASFTAMALYQLLQSFDKIVNKKI